MLDHDNWPASRLQTLAAFVSDETLRSHLQVVMIKTLDTAFRWETPSLTEISADAPTLDRPADLQAFVEHFTAEPVTVFPSFGGDGTSIVPCPMNEFSTYSHLATFVRSSPPEQYHRLLKYFW